MTRWLMERRGLVRATGAMLATPALPRFARADAEYSLRLGNSSPADHPFVLRLLEAAQAIKQESGGRVELLVFPNSQLGGDNDLLGSVANAGSGQA